MDGRIQATDHFAQDKWVIDQITAGPFKSRATRKQPRRRGKFNAKDGRALDAAIRKCWHFGAGGLPTF